MKKIIVMLLITSVLGIIGIFLAFSQNAIPRPDIAALNDVVMTSMENGGDTAVLSQKLIMIYENIDTARISRDRRVLFFLCAAIVFYATSGICLCLYCDKGILMPFQKLRKFAQNVAEGKLDIPLDMDRHGRFGAFTESFDLMRDALHTAKENERKADKSKKELVASLSHDIKTPVASIKAVSELMLVTVSDEKEKRQIEKIVTKAEQINSLITNMFHATLEELQVLSVTVVEVHSTMIPTLIQNADYEERVKPFMIPNCIVLADLLRLQQIFDNIISNSYKYASTNIEIRSAFDGGFVVIDIMDFGNGVSEDELPLLQGKFYRGKNVDKKSGYGLGLYISDYLLEQMSGKLQCENRQDGFTVKLMLRLA